MLQRVRHDWATEQQEQSIGWQTDIQAYRSSNRDQGITLMVQWASLMAQTVKTLLSMWETWFDPWAGKIPWRRKWQPTPVFSPRKSHGQRSLEDYSPRSHEKLDTSEQLTLSLSPVAKTLRSQGRGPVFHPWSGNYIPRAATKRSLVSQLRPGTGK